MITGISTIAAALITAIVTAWVAWLKVAADKRTEEQDRQDRLEERVQQLEERIDKEAEARRVAESRAHTLSLALERALDWIVRVMRWIESGATPPPPAPPDLDSLNAALSVRRPTE